MHKSFRIIAVILIFDQLYTYLFFLKRSLKFRHIHRILNIRCRYFL